MRIERTPRCVTWCGRSRITRRAIRGITKPYTPDRRMTNKVYVPRTPRRPMIGPWANSTSTSDDSFEKSLFFFGEFVAPVTPALRVLSRSRSPAAVGPVVVAAKPGYGFFSVPGSSWWFSKRIQPHASNRPRFSLTAEPSGSRHAQCHPPLGQRGRCSSQLSSWRRSISMGS